MADYSGTLNWLQNLLGTAQQNYAGQWQQGLTAEQQALADTLSNQRAMQQAGLSEGGRQFDAQLALQKVIADWQNQLAANAQKQAAQQQAYNQQMGTKSYYDMLTQNTIAQARNRTQNNPLVMDYWRNVTSKMFPQLQTGYLQRPSNYA